MLRVRSGLGCAVALSFGAGLLGVPWTAHGAARRAALIQVARLSASNGPLDFSSVAMSGSVLVAGAPQAAVRDHSNQGAVYVFARPKRGWSDETEAARLIASDGAANDDFGTSVAISGDTVVVGSAGPAVCTLAGCPVEPASVDWLYVFTRPRKGWYGVVTQRAQLTVDAAGFSGFGAIAIQGNTVVALPVPSSVTSSNAWVFTRPAGGWSGTVLPSATLAVSRGFVGSSPEASVGLSGPEIFATGWLSSVHGAVFAFHRPAGGWTGVVAQRAILTPRGGPTAEINLSPVAALGSVVFAGTSGTQSPAVVDVFARPRRGWPQIARPVGQLRPRPLPDGGETPAYIGSLAASGNTVAALVLGPTSSNCFPTNVCGETLYTFARPVHGWKGAIQTESHTAHVTAPAGFAAYPLAIAGHTIATGGGGAIAMFVQTLR